MGSMLLDYWKTVRESAEVLPSGLKVKRGTSERSGKLNLQMWKPKAVKPFANYVFPDEARREAFITYQVEQYLNSQRRRAEQKAVRAGRMEGVKLQPVEVGSIFDYSWGYDQTNIQFFQVVEKHGRHVVVRELVQHVTRSGGFMSEWVVPVEGEFLPEGRDTTRTKLVQYTPEGKAYLTMASYGWCDLWSGSPQNATHYA